MLERAEQAQVTEDLYRTVRDLLYHEAELLDSGRFPEWLELLTDDVVYQAPVRLTRERSAKADISEEMFHFDETRATLQLRVERLQTEFAWAEDPPSRTRHFVSNIRVHPTTRADEVQVLSYILIYRNRGGEASHDLLSGERRDVLRRVAGEWRLARRRVILDQATLGTKNLAIFL